MPENGRVRPAIRVATEIIRRLGAGSIAPVLLNDSNNISIHLAPLPIVARVFSVADDASVAARAARELEVCRYLARASARRWCRRAPTCRQTRMSSTA
jgi:hypothetical protein